RRGPWPRNSRGVGPPILAGAAARPGARAGAWRRAGEVAEATSGACRPGACVGSGLAGGPHGAAGDTRTHGGAGGVFAPPAHADAKNGRFFESPASCLPSSVEVGNDPGACRGWSRRLPGPLAFRPDRAMQQTTLINPMSNWRLIGLGLLVATIIVTPFVLLRQATENAEDAWRAVSHTQQVEVTVQGLAAHMRNLENGALSMASGVDNEP